MLGQYDSIVLCYNQIYMRAVIGDRRLVAAATSSVRGGHRVQYRALLTAVTILDYRK